MASSQPTRKRLVYQLETPLSTVSWPAISQEDQDTIIELLCDLLSPLGQYRQAYTKRSKGKRAAKREKATQKAHSVVEAPRPPIPELCSKIDVGLNSISKGLELSEECPNQPYSMVFVARGNQSSSFNCQFPLMVGAASKQLSPEHKIRLVGFSKPCSDRLSACLGVPRVSSVAIRSDAPGANALQEFVRRTVAPVGVVWLDEPRDRSYSTTIINSIETTVGPKRARKE